MVGEQVEGGEASSQVVEDGRENTPPALPPDHQSAAAADAPTPLAQTSSPGETVEAACDTAGDPATARDALRLKQPGGSADASSAVGARFDVASDAPLPSYHSARLQHGAASVSSPAYALSGYVEEGQAANIRERLRFLGIGDQKIVCRRECQLARRDEEALLQQLLKTAEAYAAALEKARSIGEPADGGEPVISPELAARYEERIRLIRGTVAAVSAEPPASLPALSPVERVKGLALSSFGQTATAVKGIGDQTGLSEPVAGAVSGAFTGFRGAFARAASSFREHAAPAAGSGLSSDDGTWDEVRAHSGVEQSGNDGAPARESI